MVTTLEKAAEVDETFFLLPRDTDACGEPFHGVGEEDEIQKRQAVCKPLSEFQVYAEQLLEFLEIPELLTKVLEKRFTPFGVLHEFSAKTEKAGVILPQVFGEVFSKVMEGDCGEE